MRNDLASTQGQGSSVAGAGSLSDVKLTKRSSVFSKGMKKITKSTSVLNFNQLMSNEKSESSSRPLSPTKTSELQVQADEEKFQAIGYDKLAKDSKEPIYVKYLPERTDSSVLISPHHRSTGSYSENGPDNLRSSPVLQEHPHNIEPSSAASFSSLDPNSTNNDNSATKGLKRAGFGLLNEDRIRLPRPRKQSVITNSINDYTRKNASNSSLGTYHNLSDLKVHEVVPVSLSKNQLDTFENIATHNVKELPKRSKLIRANSEKLPDCHNLSHSLQSFSAVTLNMNQIPNAEVVDILFEKLLSTRVFSDKAVKTLREQPKRRKWELLLSENESNSDFDLKSLTRSSSSCFDSPHQHKFMSDNLDHLTDFLAKHEKNEVLLETDNVANQKAKQHDSIQTLKLDTIVKSTDPNNDRLKYNSDGSIIEHDPTTDGISNSRLGIVPLSKKQKVKDGSPEWYVGRIISNKLSLKEYKKLEKKLNENDSSSKLKSTWSRSFSDAQGETALSVILTRINKKSIKSNEEFDKEFIIVKCLKNILNSEITDFEDELDDDNLSTTSLSSTVVKNKSHIIRAMIFSLISPRLATRILVTEVLIFLSYYKNADFLPSILDSMVNLQDLLGDFLRFQPWLNSVESFLDKYFTGGNNARLENEYNLKNYSLVTLLLINSIIEGTHSIKRRIPLRRELNDCRIFKIFDKLKVINDDRINEEVEKYEGYAEEDYNEFFSSESQYKSERSATIDLLNLDELFGELKSQFDVLNVSEDGGFLSNQDYIRSILRKFLMLRESGRSKLEMTKLLILIDSVMQHIVAESTVIGTDAASVLNSSIQRLIDRMITDDIARRTISETKDLSKTISVLEEQKKQLEFETSFGLNETVVNLMKEKHFNANKVSSLEKQVGLLQHQIKTLEKDKNKVAKLVEVFHLQMRNNGISKENGFVNELECVFSGRSNKAISKHHVDDPPKVNAIIDSSKNSIPAEDADDSDRACIMTSIDSVIINKDLECNSQMGITDLKPESTSIYVPHRPPTPSKWISSHAYTTQEVTLPPARPTPPPPTPTIMDSNNNDKNPKLPQTPPLPSFLQANETRFTSATLLTQPLPQPPPPPPMPPFMDIQASQTIGLERRHATPPPPPPPPLPGMLTGNNSISSFSSPTRRSSSSPPPLPLSEIEASDTTNQTESPKNINNSTSVLNADASLSDIENLSRMNVARPKTKLKQMHWDRIDDINKTFWSDIKDDDLSDKLLEKGILCEVEKVFVAKTSTIKKRKTESNNINKPKTISYLSRDLVQQFGINLHMFANNSVSELIEKILKCDKEILENISVLEFFNSDNLIETRDSVSRNFMPYSTDFTQTKKKPTKRVEELERPDRLYLELCFNMRHYWKSRSRALLLTQTYQKDYSDLLKKLQAIDEANNSIKESDNLKNVLGIIRSVGNFMNDSSKQALGFKLDTLQRLKFMKDDTNSMTFLHYVEKIIRSTFLEYGLFVDQLNPINHVSNISIEQLENDCQDFEKLIKNVESSMAKGNLSDPSKFHPDDKILGVISRPLESAKQKNSLLQSHLRRTIDDHNTLMEYFGENFNDNNSRNTFFNKFSSFVLEFKKAHIENIQKEEEQRAYVARKKMIEESKVQRDRRKVELENSNNEEGIKNEECVDDEADEISDSKQTPRQNSKQNDGSSNNAIIDDLLEKLKTSAVTSSSSRKSRERKSQYRRSKALSFYSSMSLDDLLEQPSNNHVNNLTIKKTNNKYESVDSLKRRMSTRRKLETINKNDHNLNTNTTNDADQTMIRAHAMLSQLRNERDSTDMGLGDSSEKITRSNSPSDCNGNNADTITANSDSNAEDIIVHDADTNINDSTN